MIEHLARSFEKKRTFRKKIKHFFICTIYQIEQKNQKLRLQKKHFNCCVSNWNAKKYHIT